MPRIATTGDVNNPKRKGYDFRIDDFLFRSAIGPGREMTIESSDVQANEIDVRQNPEDFTRNIGRIYSRSNFTGGSNLDMAHKRGMSELDTTRFWDSSGLNLFDVDKGNVYEIKLLFSTELEQALDSTDGDNAMAIVGTKIYVSNDETLYVSTDGGDTWSTQSTNLTSAYEIKGLAANGTDLYIVANNGSAGEIELLPDGGSSSQKSTAQIFDGIWAVKNKFLVSAGTGIYQYDGATTVGSAIITLPTGQTWTDVTDAGAVILATASDGRIYSFKDISGTFTAKGQTELSGEVPTCIIENQGQIFYGTKEVQTGNKVIGRLYRAALTVADDLYVLGNNQLIKEWHGDGDVDASPYELIATRDSIYTGIKESVSNSYLWRYYLPSAGIARDLKYGASGIIKGIGIVNEKLLATVQGSGVYQETSSYESEGYLITAAADFFTAEKKQWVEAQVETSEIDSGDSVQLHLSTELGGLSSSTHSSWDLVTNLLSGSGTVGTQLNKVSRYASAKLVITTGDGNSSPTVQSISLRALARPELVVIQIPVNISDRVERPFRKPIVVKNLGETVYQSLKDKEGTPVTLEVYDPAEVIRGVVESVRYPIQSNPNVGSVTHYAIITIRGTRQEVYGTVTSGDAYAINTYGVIRFG